MIDSERIDNWIDLHHSIVGPDGKVPNINRASNPYWVNGSMRTTSQQVSNNTDNQQTGIHVVDDDTSSCRGR